MDGQLIRLIIVEDDYLVNEEIKRSLKGKKYEIVGEANNGAQAVEMVAALKPDVVLMDIKMPIMDGLEASRRIQEKTPTPIVILTAHESEDLLEQASKTGIGAYLTKPPRAADIDRAITISIARHNDLMEMHQLCSQLEDKESNLHHMFNTSIPICITNIDYEILLANNAYKNIFQTKEHKKAVEKCYESRPGPACQTESCPLQRVQKGEKEVICEPIKTNTDGSKQYFIVTAKPFFSKDGNVLGIIESFQDITQRKIVEKERDELIAKLQKNLEEIKTLRGILPICCHCKNIRNDSGYYEQIESYIHRHSDVDFSHTICPSCMKEYYPEEYEIIMLDKK